MSVLKIVAIVLILASIAIPKYTMHVLRAREAVLREDLYTMRQAIDQYTEDKAKAPQSLEDLVSAGYLHALPKDPFTGHNDTWQPAMDDTISSPDQTEPGITDVHSGSSMTSTDGTAYNTW